MAFFKAFSGLIRVFSMHVWFKDQREIWGVITQFAAPSLWFANLCDFPLTLPVAILP